MQALFRLTFSLCAAATDLDHGLALEEHHDHTFLLQIVATRHHFGQDTGLSSGDRTSREERRQGLQKLWQQVRSAFDERPAATGDMLLSGELGRVSLVALQGGLEEDAQADQRRLDAASVRIDALSGAVADYARDAAQRVGNASALHGECRDRELRMMQLLSDCKNHTEDRSAQQPLENPSCEPLSKELSLQRQACGGLQFELEWIACNLTHEALYSPAAVGHEYRDAVANYTALETEIDTEQLSRETDSELASQLVCLQGKMRAAPRQPLSWEWLEHCSLAQAEVTTENRHHDPTPLPTLPHQPCTQEFDLEHYASTAGARLEACHTCAQITQSKSDTKAFAEEWQRRHASASPPAAASLAIA